MKTTPQIDCPLAVFLSFMLPGHFISDGQVHTHFFVPSGLHALPSSILFWLCFQWNVSLRILLLYSLGRVFHFLILNNIKIYHYRKTFYKQIPSIFFFWSTNLQDLTFFCPNYFKDNGITLEVIYWPQRETVPIDQENEQGNGPWLPSLRVFYVSPSQLTGLKYAKASNLPMPSKPRLLVITP